VMRELSILSIRFITLGESEVGRYVLNFQFYRSDS